MSEIQTLSARYGAPVERTFETVSDRLFGPINKMDRRGEVVFVLRRPGGKVLLTTKSFYPEGLFRLPTGGICLNERIEAALLREVEEETGLPAEITRFLAVIHYRIQVARITATFCSYAFELDAPHGEPRPDEDEHITAFREVEPQQLFDIARELRHLPPDWRRWGEFRALGHEVVAEVLTASPSI